MCGREGWEGCVGRGLLNEEAAEPFLLLSKVLREGESEARGIKCSSRILVEPFSLSCFTLSFWYASC